MDRLIVNLLNDGRSRTNITCADVFTFNQTDRQICSRSLKPQSLVIYFNFSRIYNCPSMFSLSIHVEVRVATQTSVQRARLFTHTCLCSVVHSLRSPTPAPPQTPVCFGNFTKAIIPPQNACGLLSQLHSCTHPRHFGTQKVNGTLARACAQSVLPPHSTHIQPTYDAVLHNLFAHEL